MSSQCIGFHSEPTGAELDHEIELGQELQPPGLMPGEQTDCGEVLEVLMVGNDIDRSFRTFEIVPPSSKCLKYSKEFLVMSVIIQFGDAQGAGMKGDRVDFTVRGDRGEDRCDSRVQGICFDYKRSSRDKVGEDRSGGECGFQGVERRLTVIRPEPRSIFLGEVGHWSDNIGVSMDKVVVEVGKPKEGLYVFNLLQSGPFLYGFNLSHVHRKSGRRQYKSEVLHSFSMKFTLCWVQEETILLEPSEYLSDMFDMLFWVLGVNKDVVEIDNHEHVKEI